MGTGGTPSLGSPKICFPGAWRSSISCRFALLEPAAKRLLRFARSTACQKALYADIFIQLRPVDTLAAGNQTPVGPLRRRPVRQPREPCEWHRDRPAIGKLHDQRIFTQTYALGKCFPEFSARSTHAITSTREPRFPRPVFQYVQFPPCRSHGSSPNGPVPANTSLCLFPLDMNMGRLIPVRRVKEQPVRPRTKNGWQLKPIVQKLGETCRGNSP